MSNRIDWSALSMKDRAEFIKIAIDNGIINRKSIIELYNKFEDGGNTEDTVYYDNTPIKTPVVKAFNSEEEYNKYYGEQFGKKVAEGMNNAAPYVLEAAMLPFTISGAVETPMLLYQGVKAAPQLVRGAKTLLTKGKKAFGKKVLGMVDDMNGYIKEGSHFRIVDKPAIDDAISSGTIRSKTGLHHDAVTYLNNNFSDYLKDIPGWNKMDANDLRGILESKGAFNNGGDALRREAMLQIRNSTNHGGSVHYFKGMPYPNYEINPTNYIIETPENIGSFVAGHGGKEFIDIPLENAGSTLLKTNGSVKGASIPSKGSSYWEYSPFFEMWKNKKFENGGDTQQYNIPTFGLGFESYFTTPQSMIADTPKTPQLYEVQQGDNFIKIANSLGVPLDEFKKVNPLENYNSISIGQKLVIPEVKQVEQPEIRQSEESKFNQYTVGEGDNLSEIAKKNNMSLDALIKANPQIKNPNIISVGQKINLTSPTTPKKVREKQWISVDELREKEKEYNKTNLGAIQGATHDSNYVVIDKKGKKLTVYDSDNNVVYETSDISTGLSGNDYNTKTFTRNGRDVYGEGNMSTPAGVTRISSMDMYHGAPSFQRVRLDSYGNPKKVYDKNGKEIDDTINSSFHLGSIDKLYSSNGCVRMSKKALNDLGKYIDVGTLVYTLPDKNESRFVLKDGNLNYEADNPFGVTEKGKTFNKYGHDMVYQDDYNVFNNKTSSPIKIEYVGEADLSGKKKENVQRVIDGITSNKEVLQKAFNISDFHFNKIAQLAMGILEQESKFGTSSRYRLKEGLKNTDVSYMSPSYGGISPMEETGITLFDVIKSVKGNNTYDSLGMGQIKLEGDNEETQKMYRKFGITPENVASDEKTAEALMVRLLSMYRNEVQGREFKNKETGAIIDPYDALLYKYKGGTAAKVLRKGEATGKNTYVLNVKNYAKDFKFYTYK